MIGQLLLQVAAEHAAEHAAPAQHATEGAAPGGHSPAEVLMHHVTDSVIFTLNLGPLHLPITKHLLFFIGAAAFVLVVARLALRSYQKGGVPRGLGAAVHRASTTAPVIGGNYFAVGRKLDMTVRGAGRTQMNELMMYEVKDGRIVLEQFFY